MDLPLVLLLREPEAPDPYEEALRANGFRAASVPVLAFDYVGQERLREVLAAPDAYGGLIATSPRSVRTLAEVWPQTGTQNTWLAKPTYVVGPRTAEEMRRLGFDPKGEGAGSAEALAPLIAPADRPLVFLCGNRTRDVLPTSLRAAGIPFEPVRVYKTRLRNDLDFSSLEAPSWLVFFSPSGLEAVQREKGIDLHHVKKAAIGPTTAAALQSAGLPPDAVAGTPTPEALLHALTL